MNKLSLPLITALISSGMAFSALAESSIDVSVGAEVWGFDTKIENSRKGSDTTGVIYVAIEHQIPYAPDVKLRYTPIDTKEVSFDQTDVTFYYEVLTTKEISFDIGMTMMNFSNGEFTSNAGQHFTFSEWEMNWYADASLLIPNTNFYIFGQFDFGSNDETRTMDGQAGVKYRRKFFDTNMDIKMGYRVMDHEFGYFEGLDNMEGNAMVDGWFAGVAFSY
ncbi:MAG: TIGR04219 family outer membrane beta-barrel protein [Aliivibrio sp.]|uniref:TIGR04219 family outer membrane beta-barrel protein n=1 Tax=Aliivibrio sp. TaxID=1872443 RepID=UPI001A6435A5|nr:TIGR04219 family outer membrane beta-barrel protein [Aliivibrio sp.]